MRFGILVKVVPALDELAYDPTRRTAVREGAELFVNPFDQRAVRVALDLRRPGDAVTVFSLGPPNAVSALKELRAIGADRVLLLSDPKFAGSDVLATARILALAVRQVGVDVVLAGAWTTDSETGAVGPEVAGLLGVPIVTGARSIVRSSDGDRFEVTADTSRGWITVRLRTPVVLTVGEKIAKPLHATPEEIARWTDAAVERVDAPALGIDPELVGAAGSPTIVLAVEDIAPTRSAVVCGSGSTEDRVRDALEVLRPRLRPPPSAPVDLPPEPRSLDEDREVAVLVTNDLGELDPSAVGIVSEIRRSLRDHWPSVIWYGPPPDESATYRLGSGGALAGVHLDPGGDRIDSTAAAEALSRELPGRPGRVAVAIVASPFGKEVAGRLAAIRGLGLVGDATGFRGSDDGSLVWSKPSFGGRTIAMIATRTRPGLATVHAGLFSRASEAGGSGFRWRAVAVEPSTSPVERVAEGLEPGAAEDLDRGDVVVAVGMGVGGPEGVERVRTAAADWGAILTGTRRVIDAGWLPRRRQVGLTGVALAPRLAVLVGVRGAINHMVGWQRAGAILAVNPDPDAPVFRAADVGIVGRWEEVLPILSPRLRPLLGR